MKKRSYMAWPPSLRTNPSPDIGCGLLGLSLAVLSIIFGAASSSAVFRISVYLLFVLGAANCLIVGKVWSAIGWVTFAMGFFLGYEIMGRLGILIGLLIAFFIVTPLINSFEYSNRQ